RVRQRWCLDWRWYYRCWYFFFQAEDGIRDRNVTGVQTCALPICCCVGLKRSAFIQGTAVEEDHKGCQTPKDGNSLVWSWRAIVRSEERRVGKEDGRRGSGCQRQRKAQGEKRRGSDENETEAGRGG